MKYLHNFGLDVLSKSTGVGSALGGTKTLSISLILATALLTVISYLLPNL